MKHTFLFNTLTVNLMLFLRLFSVINRTSAFPSPPKRGLACLSRPLSPLVITKSSCNQHGRNIRSAWLVAGFLFLANEPSLILCHEKRGDVMDSPDYAIKVPPFGDSALTYDHYNGVTVNLENLDDISSEASTFAKNLEQALVFWKAEGRKGIWIHATSEQAHLIPHCVNLGFSFHFVKNNKLVLSQWLPDDTPSKLPMGPTHQVGVGTVVFHPKDPSLMLVVKEKTGPAAAYDLWKMPTGLLDPEEDIPDAATRELKEETGLDGKMEGIVCFRQAHSPSRSSDLFFVCHMSLQDPENPNNWQIQEDEIADIQWMPVEDYCNQNLWQGSPVYEALNESIRKASMVAKEQIGRNANGMIIHQQLSLGRRGKGTNALFKSQL